jgi:hypothetical protein
LHAAPFEKEGVEWRHMGGINAEESRRSADKHSDAHLRMRRFYEIAKMTLLGLEPGTNALKLD